MYIETYTWWDICCLDVAPNLNGKERGKKNQQSNPNIQNNLAHLNDQGAIILKRNKNHCHFYWVICKHGILERHGD